MRISVTLLFIFCLHTLGAQVRTINVHELNFITIRDSTKSGINEDPLFRFNEIVRYEWTQVASQSNTNPTVQSPLYHKGIVFVPNILDYAYDGLTGKAISFGSQEAKGRFREFGKDTLVSFTGLQGFRAVIVNIMTGQKCIELDNQPQGKAPFFLSDRTWLYVKWKGSVSMLTAKDIESNVDLWSIPFQKFTLNKTTITNNILFIADDNFLYAIELRTGKVLWKIPMKINYINQNQDVLFVSGADGLFGIDIKNPNDPSVQWKLESTSRILDLDFQDNLIYIQRHNSLLAFDSKFKTSYLESELFLQLLSVRSINCNR